MNLNVKMNRVYIPYFDKKQFIQIFFGGSSSGKSYFICQKIVLDNLKEVNWLVCRNVARTIRNSTFNEIVKAIQNMRLSRLYAINKTDMAITNLKNGKQILFVGLEPTVVIPLCLDAVANFTIASFNLIWSYIVKFIFSTVQCTGDSLSFK